MQNGKGDTYRQVDQKKFSENYDLIFKKASVKNEEKIVTDWPHNQQFEIEFVEEVNNADIAKNKDGVKLIYLKTNGRGIKKDF